MTPPRALRFPAELEFTLAGVADYARRRPYLKTNDETISESALIFYQAKGFILQFNVTGQHRRRWPRLYREAPNYGIFDMSYHYDFGMAVKPKMLELDVAGRSGRDKKYGMTNNKQPYDIHLICDIENDMTIVMYGWVTGEFYKNNRFSEDEVQPMQILIDRFDGER